MEVEVVVMGWKRNLGQLRRERRGGWATTLLQHACYNEAILPRSKISSSVTVSLELHISTTTTNRHVHDRHGGYILHRYHRRTAQAQPFNILFSFVLSIQFLKLAGLARTVLSTRPPSPPSTRILSYQPDNIQPPARVHSQEPTTARALDHFTRYGNPSRTLHL